MNSNKSPEVKTSLVETKEMNFHDLWAESQLNDKLYFKESFESNSSPEGKQIRKWMGEIKNKKILELGCGLGEASIYFATQGADVTATDISPMMLEVVKKNALSENVTVKTCQVSANSLDNIADNYFDFAYAGNLLHHVEIASCIAELHKKIKPGGKVLFWDPMAYNPAINVYRRKATEVRTTDEHPLKISDLKLISSKFKTVQLKFFWFTGLYIFFKYYFIDKVDPNKVRYWKKILEDSPKLQGPLGLCHKLDQALFFLIPGLKYWAWNVAICATK